RASWCRARHDLHSFPPRRSSDLGPGAPRADRGPPFAGPLLSGEVVAAPEPSRAVRRPRRDGPVREAAVAREPTPAREHAGAGLQDRKSTRLNSSHVKISYAVFGL